MEAESIIGIMHLAILLYRQPWGSVSLLSALPKNNSQAFAAHGGFGKTALPPWSQRVSGTFCQHVRGRTFNPEQHTEPLPNWHKTGNQGCHFCICEGNGRLRDYTTVDIPEDIGEAEGAALELVGQPFVVDPKEV